MDENTNNSGYGENIAAEQGNALPQEMNAAEDISAEPNGKKEKKKKKKRTVRVRTLLIWMLVTIIATVYLTNLFQDRVLVYFPSSSPEKQIERKLKWINNHLDGDYLYDADKSKQSEEALKTYVSTLNEKYTKYYPPDEFKTYMSRMEDSYMGIGVVISENENNEIVVVAPYEDGSAYEAGVKPGDIITAVDGKEYNADTMSELVSYIRSGKKDTEVTLTVKRDGAAMDIKVKRTNVATDSVHTRMLDNNIGYIRISEFNTNEKTSERDTYTEFKQDVKELQEQGMQKMVIDLRDNPGGALDVVCNVADMLVGKGIITYLEYKNGKREDHYSDENEIDMPMTVLINKNSASASEVLTGCLKDYHKATIIGEKSFGKGIVQSVYPYADGGGMSMTVARYFTPSGVCIHGTGIEPDIAVATDEKYKDMYASQIPIDDDAVLKKALEVLTQ